MALSSNWIRRKLLLITIHSRKVPSLSNLSLSMCLPYPLFLRFLSSSCICFLHPSFHLHPLSSINPDNERGFCATGRTRTTKMPTCAPTGTHWSAILMSMHVPTQDTLQRNTIEHNWAECTDTLEGPQAYSSNILLDRFTVAVLERKLIWFTCPVDEPAHPAIALP